MGLLISFQLGDMNVSFPAVFAFKRFRFFVCIFETVEKDLSTAAEVAGTDKIFMAILSNSRVDVKNE